MKYQFNSNLTLFLSLALFFVTANSKAQDLNIGGMIQPIPKTARFINDTSYIWCGTLVKSHIDQKYHLFYSRWPRQYGMAAWVTKSEVAHAVSDSPFGPFEFRDIALPVRGSAYWDGMVTHNPTLQFYNGKYSLY